MSYNTSQSEASLWTADNLLDCLSEALHDGSLSGFFRGNSFKRLLVCVDTVTPKAKQYQ